MNAYVSVCILCVSARSLSTKRSKSSRRWALKLLARPNVLLDANVKLVVYANIGIGKPY